MRASSVVTALLCVAVLSGCGSGSDRGGGDDSYRLPTSDVQVPLDETSWMQGTTLHVDGRSVDTGVRAESYALLPDGVLLLRRGRLSFSDTRHRARVVGAIGGADTLRVSPDGKHVAFLDRLHGPADDSGEHFLRLDVLDTRTGRQVVASAQGMGDLSETVGEQYEEYDPDLVALDDDAAYVRGPRDVYWRHPVDGSAPRKVAERDVPRTDRPVTLQRTGGRWRQDPDGTEVGSVSPDGRTGLADTLNSGFHPYDARSGKPLTFRVPAGVNRFALGGWQRDGFWGFALRGQYADPVGTGQIVRCTLADRICTPVSGRLTATSERPVLLGVGTG